MIRRLEAIGICGPLLSWFKSYLTCRRQYTSCNGSSSTELLVKAGVPQGSVLGPRLFSVFVNDLPSILAGEGIEVVMHADDLSIIAFGSDQREAALNLESCLAKLHIWSCSSRLAVHPGKSEILIIRQSNRPQRHDASTLQCHYAGVPIPVKATIRLLGVTIDGGLTISAHLGELIKKAEGHLALLRRTKHLPFDARQRLWLQKLLPTISYAITIWRSGPKLLVGKLDALHRHAAKVLLGRPFRDDGHLALRDIGWDSLDLLYKKKLLMLGFSAANKTCPPPVQQFFRGSATSRGSSSANQRFVLPSSSAKSISRNAVSFRTMQLWNMAPKAIKSSCSSSALKRLLKANTPTLVSFLQNFCF